jgi:hypothetical protein
MIVGKLGKLAPKHDPRTLRLSRYILPDEVRWREIPAARDWREACTPDGSRLPPDTNPLGNNEYGDCTVASKGHYLLRVGAMVGRQVDVTRERILADYAAITGFDPVTGAGDEGAYMLDVMKHWRNVGICGEKILAFASVDPTDRVEMQVALELFGGVFTGWHLPVTIEGQDVWDVPQGGFPPGQGPGSLGGHEIDMFGRSPGSGNGTTWGERAAWTMGFHDACCCEAYVGLLPWYMLAGGKSPCGLSLDDLLADVRNRAST